MAQERLAPRYCFVSIAALFLLSLISFNTKERAIHIEENSELHSSSPLVENGSTSPNPSKRNCDFALKDRRKESYTQCTNCTSMLNQDEILRNIFDTIGETNRHCVEFGFGYQWFEGTKSNSDITLKDLKGEEKVDSGLNCHALIKQNWKPTFFDAESSNEDINLYKWVLTPDNIGDAFKHAQVPIKADYVSIDVDSIDVWLFQSLLSKGYRPRVFSVEYNQNFPVDSLVSAEKKWAPWKRRCPVFGASASSINMIAELFEYQVVEIMPTNDMFFIRKDILEEKCFNVESLPTYLELAKGFVGGQTTQKLCEPEDAARLVDFPLALLGLEDEAKAKARTDIRRINNRRKAAGNKKHLLCGDVDGYS
mmetsp:Transcript_38113/g.88701  ORF Transcript_38113/g.88701 Transcript_38113/m.88701 type:complete len:366 (-) Transcript_38113:128-1225(-)